MAWLLADWNIRKFTGLAFVTGVAPFFCTAEIKRQMQKAVIKPFASVKNNYSETISRITTG